MSLRFHIVLLLSIMCLTVAGCYPHGPISIMTYDRHSPSSEDFQSLARDKSPMFYNVGRANEQGVIAETCDRISNTYILRFGVSGDRECRLLHEIPDSDLTQLRSVLNETFIERGVLPNVIYVHSRPVKGTHLLVEVWREWLSPIEKMSATQSVRVFLYGMTAGILPVTIEWEYNIRYTLYIDHEAKQTNTYKITKREFDCTLCLPIAWMNFLTPSKRDAFESTAYEFLLDAQRHGFLQETGKGMEPTERR